MSAAAFRGGLTRRTIVASGLLALVVGAAFAVLLVSIIDLRGAERRALGSQEVLVVANGLERRIVDLETSERGFVISGQDAFLVPWTAAQAAIPAQAATLERLVAGNPEQVARAQRIAQGGTSYIRDYSIPLVAAARRDAASVRTATAIAEGKRRLDAIRAEFDGFVATEQSLAEARQSQSNTAVNRAILAAAAGLAGSIILIVVFAGYLSRAIVLPVRRAAAHADRLAGGDLSARLPERSPGEIGVLERSFNSMAGSLQESREELGASRARIVAAADQERRRIERDLHDGTQQRLVSVVLDLRAAEATLAPEFTRLRAHLAHVAAELAKATDELRELSRGIHPAILSEGGLSPAFKALARRSAVPVVLDLDVPQRLPEHVEVAAYYVVSEALTNAAKHAHASVAEVAVHASHDSLHLSIHDDGVGGATTRPGSGLIGLTDRIQALGGTFSVTSPRGKGTDLLVDLPLQTPSDRRIPADR
ncbi:MAG TPA: CHASE3 domain-containing protein [Kribbella sp.]